MNYKRVKGGRLLKQGEDRIGSAGVCAKCNMTLSIPDEVPYFYEFEPYGIGPSSTTVTNNRYCPACVENIS